MDWCTVIFPVPFINTGGKNTLGLRLYLLGSVHKVYWADPVPSNQSQSLNHVITLTKHDWLRRYIITHACWPADKSGAATQPAANVRSNRLLYFIAIGNFFTFSMLLTSSICCLILFNKLLRITIWVHMLFIYHHAHQSTLTKYITGGLEFPYIRRLNMRIWPYDSVRGLSTWCHLVVEAFRFHGCGDTSGWSVLCIIWPPLPFELFVMHIIIFFI